jgi:hypothetical protein
MKLEIDSAFGFALFRNDPHDLALASAGVLMPEVGEILA